MINLYTCSVKTTRLSRVKNKINETKRERDEKIISRLVSKFGLAAVQTALATILPRCSWSDWQSAANFAVVASRRISRKRREKRLEKLLSEKREKGTGRNRADGLPRGVDAPARRPTPGRAGRHDALRNMPKYIRLSLAASGGTPLGNFGAGTTLSKSERKENNG